MSEEEIPNSKEVSSRTTAVSVFDQANAMNDFPVLKAFQEYIDAEQARSRKRMLWLSIFFIVLLVVVVVTFSMFMATVINRDQLNLSMIATRNQELSDKLLDIALRERVPTAQPVVNVQQPVPMVQQHSSDQTALLKPMLDRLEQLAAKFGQPRDQQQSTSAVAAQSAQARESAETRRLRQDQDEIRRQREAVAAERKKLKEEQERLHQEQVERHRRRLYPEYYAQEDARKMEEERNAAKRAQCTLPAAVAVETPSSARAVVSVSPPSSAKATVAVSPESAKTEKRVSYFDEDSEDEQSKPATVAAAATVETSKGAVGTESLTVEGKDGEQIPWLIELPEKK